MKATSKTKKGVSICHEGGARTEIKSHTLSKNTQNTWGLAGQPRFTPILISKAVNIDPPP